MKLILHAAGRTEPTTMHAGRVNPMTWRQALDRLGAYPAAVTDRHGYHYALICEDYRRVELAPLGY